MNAQPNGQTVFKRSCYQEMMFENLKGLVLRYTNYRDNDRILQVLTREKGLISLTARGCRSSKSRLSAACESCVYGEFVIYGRGKIKYVSSAEVLEAFYPIREDYEKLLSAMQIMHTAEISAYSAAGTAELFALCYHSLSFIAYGETVPKDIEICFTAKLLQASGYTPVLTKCVRCGKSLIRQHEVYFSRSQGGAMCDYCGSGCMKVSALALEALRRMLLLPLNDMGRVRLPENARKELDELIYSYAEYVFEQMIRLRV